MVSVPATALFEAPASAATITLTKPAGVQDRDQLVAVAMCWNDTTVTPPAGWTTVATRIYTGGGGDPGDHVIWCGRRYIGDGEADGLPASWSLGLAASRTARVSIVAILRDVGTKWVAGQSGLGLDPPAITTAADDSVVVSVLGQTDVSVGDWSLTPPAGYTLIDEHDSTHATNNVELAVAYKLVATAGSENPGAWSSGNGDAASGYITTAVGPPSELPGVPDRSRSLRVGGRGSTHQ